jgi:cyclopropane-fatty-acyl-phospholipid synthase
LDNIARELVFSIFENVEHGHVILTENGETKTFGQPQQDTDLVAHIHVHEPWAYRQVLFNGSVGSGEAYMMRGWTSPEPLHVIQIFVRNRQCLYQMDKRWTKLKGYLCWLFHRANKNTLSGSNNNISAHYDLSNDFFGLFLDQRMMYSAAVYKEVNASLEQASEQKLRQVCEALQLQPDDHLLEIGTGWGGLAVYAAKHFGCRVTTTTISDEQYEFAKDLVEKESLQGQVTVLKEDYRRLTGAYDKLVSIEMIEAVGHKFYSQFFNVCSSLLKRNGLMLIQAITIADQNYRKARGSVDFIQRYIFPGGALPSIEVISHHLRKDTDMQIVGLTDITQDYARTLGEWRSRFWHNIDAVRQLGFDDVFERMWDFYLVYCQGGFIERSIGTVQMLMAKPNAREFPKVIG